jgi:hypothetical protein
MPQATLANGEPSTHGYTRTGSDALKTSALQPNPDVSTAHAENVPSSLPHEGMPNTPSGAEAKDRHAPLHSGRHRGTRSSSVVRGSATLRSMDRKRLEQELAEAEAEFEAATKLSDINRVAGRLHRVVHRPPVMLSVERQQCGQSFRAKRGTGRYCSVRCRNVASSPARRRQRGWNSKLAL